MTEALSISSMAAHNPEIVVIDSLMGTGKTTYALNMMEEAHLRELGQLFGNEEPEQARFLYIAPTLNEVERVIEALPDLDFRDPVPVNGRKANHLNTLVEEGANIVSTHALFQKLDRETFAFLNEHRYTLIIDEALECVSPYPLKQADLQLLRGGCRPHTVVDEQGRLRWNYRDYPHYDGKFSQEKALCDNGNLVVHEDSIILWEFPAEFLRCFSKVYILTYLFEGAPMSAYLRANGLAYTRYGIEDGELKRAEQIDDAAQLRNLRSLITIVEDPKLNAIGRPMNRECPLSASWFDRKKRRCPEVLKKLKRNTEEFFRRHANTPSRDNLWTTLKEVMNDLKGRQYTKGFAPLNCKGTNDFIDKKSVAYLANVYCRPDVVGYLRSRGADVDEDLYALSEMLQFIWRSQIRRGDPIIVYIPSERMRGLLKAYLEKGIEGVAKKTSCEFLPEKTSQDQGKIAA